MRTLENIKKLASLDCVGAIYLPAQHLHSAALKELANTPESLKKIVFRDIESDEAYGVSVKSCLEEKIPSYKDEGEVVNDTQQ